MILVVDFGGQYNQLIVRRVREANIYAELVSCKKILEAINKNKNLAGIILSGGPHSVYEKNSPRLPKEIFDLNIPILGICYGAQILIHELDGEVAESEQKEYGKIEIIQEKNNSSEIFYNIKEKSICWMSHKDYVKSLPDGFKIIAHTNNCPVAAFENNFKKIYGVQFHPEVLHTEFGFDLIKNFLYRVCNLKPNWNVEDFITKKIKEIKSVVGNKKVICALSGGVDSTVAAVLVNKAIGENLFCVFVDNGLLRKNEAQKIIETYKKNLNLKIISVDASKIFLSKLKNIIDPEEKRKIIGAEFIKIFEKEKEKLADLYEDIDFLLQGTIYPDVIESGTENAAVIKSHHNVGGLPKNIKLKLIEPLRFLFKDEVRKLGMRLNLPDEIISRQPFPGPGLAIRCLGEVNSDKLKIIREADKILRDEIKLIDLKVWQCFVVLVNSKSVGVMGDFRTYSYIIAIRIVNSIDGMTCDWVRVPYDVLNKISNRIVNEVDGVNRVVYDITSKPPGTIEWE